jgi:hypothetical protein
VDCFLGQARELCNSLLPVLLEEVLVFEVFQCVEFVQVFSF